MQTRRIKIENNVCETTLNWILLHLFNVCYLCTSFIDGYLYIHTVKTFNLPRIFIVLEKFICSVTKKVEMGNVHFLTAAASDCRYFLKFCISFLRILVRGHKFPKVICCRPIYWKWIYQMQLICHIPFRPRHL